MAIGLLGRKIGMTRIYGEDGGSTPVTVLEIAANRVSQVKTVETDGYDAIQLSAGEKKSSRVSKSEAGHFAKAGVPAGYFCSRVASGRCVRLRIGCGTCSKHV